MSVELFVRKTLAVGLISLFSAGLAHAELIRETTLGSGMWSGGLQLPVQSSPANYWSGFQTIEVNNGVSTTSFMALCVDPFQWSPSAFTSYTITNFNTFFGARAGDVTALFNEAFSGALTNNLAAGAMQLALWEVANDDKNLGTGAVRTVLGTNSALTSAAQGLLGNLSAYAGPSQYSFAVFTSATNQDYLVATPIPEPEVYAMLVAGLGMLAFLKRRRKSLATA